MKTRNHADEAAAVRIWLASQGYPLELRVGRILRDAGWHVEHARWFEDLETGKLRELDVTATLWFEASRVEPAVKLEIAVECKSSPSKPWVAFTTQRQDVSPWLRPTAVADEYSRDALTTASARKVTIPELIRPTTRLSHGVVKAHSEGKSGDPTSPYSTLRGVVAAARSIGRENAEIALVARTDACPCIVVPVVVLTGSLYEYRLQNDESEMLSPVDYLPALAPGLHTGDSPVVWIVRFGNAKEFFLALTQELSKFARDLVPYAADPPLRLRKRVESRDRAVGTL